jgi:rare lipoprotein A (peptidoglycan hydrolase)
MSNKTFIGLCLGIVIAGMIGIRTVQNKITLAEIRDLANINGEKIREISDELSAVSEKVDRIERNLRELGFDGGQVGLASFYNYPFHGRLTASGERFDKDKQTAAHRTAQFGTWALVENLLNGRRTLTRITDRGPFIDGRILDLSEKGARDLGMIHAGVVPVRIKWITRDMPIARPGTGD